MSKSIQVRAEYTPDSGTGAPGVDCWIGDEMRTISLSDATEGNEYNALQDLPGYAEHGAALWVEIDSLLIERTKEKAMPDDPNQTAICNAAIDRSTQDALTIARLCEEIVMLRQRLKVKTQTVIDQDVLRRSVEKSLRDEIDERSRERSREFQSAIKQLNKQLKHERREREAAQRTIARLGGVECLNIK